MSQNSPPTPPSPQQPPQGQGPGAGPPGAPGPGTKKGSPLLPGGWIILVIATVLAVVYFSSGQYREIEYGQFTDLVNAGQVKKIVFIGSDRIEGEIRDGNAEIARPFLKGSTKFSVNLLHTQD